MKINLRRLMGFVTLGVVFVPSVAWGVCGDDAPLFSTASSHYSHPSIQTTFEVAARDFQPGCKIGDTLTVTAPGLDALRIRYQVSAQAGAASMTVYIAPSSSASSATAGTYNITYHVTDSKNNTASISLPLTIGGKGSAPRLDPVTDLIVGPGQFVAFSVAVSDLDGDLNYSSPETLRITGLPDNSKISYDLLTATRMSARVAVTNALAAPGTYRVHITGKDKGGNIAFAQMRIIVNK